MKRSHEKKYYLLLAAIAVCIVANFLLYHTGLFNIKNDSAVVPLSIMLAALIFTGLSIYLLRRHIFSGIPRVKTVMGMMKELDLSTEINFNGKGRFSELNTEAKEMFGSFKNMYKELLELSSGINTSMSHLWNFLNTSVETVENQKRQGEQIASASEEMSSMILDIAKNADSSAELSLKVTEDASKGMESMKLGIKSIDALAESTENLGDMVQKLDNRISEVGEIVNIINDIADQTNLLALNAAIEAARAGEQGRGFAVVADEVRKLAEKTMSATADISAKIEGIQKESHTTASQMKVSKGNVEDSVQHINSTRNALEKIVGLAGRSDEQIKKIATAINQQSVTTEEISQGLDNFNQTVIGTSNEMVNITRKMVVLSKKVNSLTDYIAKFRMPEDVGYVMEFFKIAHKNWVQKLYRMYYSGEAVDPSKIIDHKECRLGKWYFSQGYERYGSMPEFTRIEKPHKEIHVLAKKAAEVYQNGDKSRALGLIKDVDSVSEEVIDCLENFRNAVFAEETTEEPVENTPSVKLAAVK